MMWVVVGMLTGAVCVLASQSWTWLAVPIDALTVSLSHAGEAVARAAVRGLGLGGHTPLEDIAGAVAAALAPALVCLLVAEAVSATRAARNAAAALFTGVALSSFLWLPGPEALALVLAALALDLTLAFTHGLLLTFPSAVVITAVTGRILLDVWQGTDRFAGAAATLATVGGHSGMWQLMLSAAAVTGCVAALGILLRRS